MHPRICQLRRHPACEHTPHMRAAGAFLQAGGWLSSLRQRLGGKIGSGDSSIAEAEAAVLAALSGVQGRGPKGLDPQQLADFEAAVEVLEADGGLRVCSSGLATLHRTY